jgi:hypothetical protein
LLRVTEALVGFGIAGHRTRVYINGVPRDREGRTEGTVIPAWLVRTNLDDPRKIPYLLAWKDDDRHDGKIMEAVRLARATSAMTTMWT